MSPSATPPARRRGRTTANELSRFFELLRAGGELDGVRILEPRTIRRATSERAFREIDFSLVAPLRHAADPERALSVGLVTSGKPMLHPALGELVHGDLRLDLGPLGRDLASDLLAGGRDFLRQPLIQS